ncbi:MAG: hypothetical protein KBT88_00940 [Gammaproteobacteria bacterium]|nr:hypothetical protein [Gammaproteobacteria bacterium]MBQ0838319.1 hypothetical protein [Gammaproteobacteria bacterium]
MEERRQLARLQGRIQNLDNLGFTELDNVDFETLPFSATLLDESYIKNNSDNYLLIGGHMLKQLYTKTEFGILIIDETVDSVTTLASANIELNSEPATFTHVKHKGGKWATVVYAPSGDRLFIVESDRKLTGKMKDRFIEMVADLLRRSY